MNRRMDGWADRRMVTIVTALLSAHPTIRPSALQALASPLGFAQCPDGTPPPCRVQPARVAPPPNSVAVLYFDNLSPDTADAYLADGLTEELTAQLGQVECLRVKSRTAVERHRARAADHAAFARTLGVAYVVRGSVRRSGNRVRVTVEVAHGGSGDRVWGGQYDREDGDALTIEREIALDVVTAVVGRLLPSERRSLTTLPTRNRAAYDRYLRGLFLFRRRVLDPRAVALALREFEGAAELDPTFAPAQARIGIAYGQLLLAPGSSVLPPDTLLARGLAATDRALALDSTVADAWIARGRLLAQHVSPLHPAVRAAYERAVMLDPRNPEAHNFLGFHVLLHWADAEGARPALERAVALDPEHPTYLNNLGVANFAARRYVEALRWWDSTLVVAPEARSPLENRAMVRFALGDLSGARADAESANRLSAGPWPVALLALLDLRRGDTSAARAVAARLVAEGERPDPVRALSAAAVLTALGESERAIDYLARVSPREGRGLPLVLSYVFLDSLRSHPRFRRLVEETRPR